MTEKEKKEKIVIDGSGTFHSLLDSTFRMIPREELTTRIVKHLPVFEAFGGSPLTETTLEIGRVDFKVFYEKDRRVVILEPQWHFGVDEIIIDRTGDKYDVYGIIDGKKMPAEDIVFKVPGSGLITLKGYVDLLLMGLGWAFLRRGGDVTKNEGEVEVVE